LDFVLGDVARLVYAANSYSKPLVLYLGKLEMGSTKARRAGDRRDGVADSGLNNSMMVEESQESSAGGDGTGKAPSYTGSND